MTDWTVTVKTKSGFIKEVDVNGYNYPNDAVNEALSKTGASEFIHVAPTINQVENQSSTSKINSNYICHSNIANKNFNSKKQLIFLGLFLFGMFFSILVSPVGFFVIIGSYVYFMKNS